MCNLVWLYTTQHMTFKQRRLNVDATSWRCIDVEATLYRRHVSARHYPSPRPSPLPQFARMIASKFKTWKRIFKGTAYIRYSFAFSVQGRQLLWLPGCFSVPEVSSKRKYFLKKEINCSQSIMDCFVEGWGVGGVKQFWQSSHSRDESVNTYTNSKGHDPLPIARQNLNAILNHTFGHFNS